MDSRSIICLPGAGLRPWIWDETFAHLDLPGIVIDYDTGNTTLQDYVNQTIAAITATKSKRYILIGHSIGGVIASDVAKLLGDKLAGLIAISAVIPQPGDSFVASLPYPQKLLMPLIVHLVGTTPPESALRKSLCKGLTPQQTNQIIRDFRPESKNLFLDKTSFAPLPQVPSLYIVTTADSEFSASFQYRQAERLPAPRIGDINSGHLPMITHSKQLSGAIRDFVHTL